MAPSRTTRALVAAVESDAKRRRAEAAAEIETKQAWEAARDWLRGSELDDGFARVEELEAKFEELESDGTYRSAGQAELHKFFVSACARIIFGAGFHEKRIMDKFGWRRADMVQSISVVTPRRWGKSECVSQFIYAMLMVVPLMDIAVFAPVQSQANAVVEKVFAILMKKHPEQKHRMRADRLLLDFGPADQRQVHAHCSNTDAVRGVKGRLVVIDESFFVPDDVREVLVAPLMAVDEATMLCISTENKKKADSPDLHDQYDEHGDLMCRAYRYATVCQSCVNKGEKENCPHTAHRLPPWLSMRKMPLVNYLMRGNKANRDRELYGLSSGGDDHVFPRLRVDEMFARPRFRFPLELISHVYVGIDPNTGKHNSRATGGSDFVMVSFYESSGRTVVCGAEAIDASDQRDYMLHLFNHLTRLRSTTATCNAVLVIAAEMNLGNEASHIEEFVNSRFTRVVFMQETELKTGVPTTAPLKREMAHCLRARLQRGSVEVADEFVCSHGTAETVLDKMHEQLNAYSEKRTQPSDPLKGAVVQYSGKMHGKRDDLAMGLQLACFWSGVYKTSSKYGHHY